MDAIQFYRLRTRLIYSFFSQFFFLLVLLEGGGGGGTPGPVQLPHTPLTRLYYPRCYSTVLRCY